MKRRTFMTLIGSAAAAWPLRTGAQERIPKIGLLRTNAPPDPFVDAFRDGMRTLGYEEGHTVLYETRWAEGKPDRLPLLAAELTALNVDIILTGGDTAIQAAQNAAPTTPIVMGASNDPFGAGLHIAWHGPAGWRQG
jgi:putative tryptophan/tyrosine transport system substrate-binding protein